MDLYQKNPTTLRRLLAKRQNPCAQILTSQSSSETQNLLNPTNLLTSKINLLNKANASSPGLNYITEHLQNTQNSTNLLRKSMEQNSGLQGQKFKNSTINEPITIIDLESDSFEPNEKKLKVSESGSVSRRTSFDEEKYSEHSTTCDNHSESNYNPETGDSIWSPMMSAQAQPSKDPVILVLDEDEEVPSKSEAPLQFADQKDALIYAEARCQAEMHGGSCLSTEGLSRGKLKFMCKFGHHWEATLEEMNKRWCTKCANMINKCRAFAYANGGSCLTEKFDETISFKCHIGHVWNASSRNYNNKWCAQCIQDEKDLFKKKCEEARAKREKMEEECQQKLFEEARRKAMNGVANQGTYSKEDMLKYFQKIDAEVEARAKQETEKFMSNGANNNVSYEQALHVYKVLLTPEDILKKYMMSLTAENLKSEFRRMAKVVHPDKNKHPNAGCAFKKIYKVYETMINK